MARSVEAESMDDLLKADYHQGVWGKTGSGKSVVGNIIHARMIDGPSIFMTPPEGWKADFDIEGVEFWKGENKRKMKEFRKALKHVIKEDRNVAYKADPETYKQEFRWVRKVAMKAARQYKKDVWIWVDEAHKVMPTDDDNENPLKQGLEEDRDEGIHYGLISQKPDKCNRDGVSEIDKHIFLKLSEFARGLIDYLGLDYQQLRDDLQEVPEHHFKVYDAGEGYVEFKGENRFKLDISN